MEKLPPIEKVYEAWSAIADGRVALDNATATATVTSSDGTRTYTVRHDGPTYLSNDSATFWQGYPGYPVLAVMMLEGVLPYDAAEASQWADINWNALNKRYRRDYAAAVAHIEAERSIDPVRAAALAATTLEALAATPATVHRLKNK